MQQVKVTLNDEDMDTFVFAVGTKKAMARLQKEMQDLVNHPHPSMFDGAAPALIGQHLVSCRFPPAERVLRGQAQVWRQIRAAGLAGHPERDGGGDGRSDGQQGLCPPLCVT